MKNRFRIAALALAVGGILAGPALAQDEMPVDGRWYATLIGGAAFVDGDRMAKDDWPYYGASIGRFLSRDFSLELQIDTYESDFEDSVAVPAGLTREFENFSYGLFGRYHWGDYSNFRPFLLLGVGIQEHDSFLDNGRDIFGSAGIGATAEFGDHWRLRTQFEARYDNDRRTFDSDDGFLDGIFSLGLSYAFGEPPRPPRPEPAPARPAPPPPAPAPAPAPEPPPEPEVLFELDSTVTFAFDSSEIREEAEEELTRVADILRQRREIILIEVAGHTDSIGTEEYNMDLSLRRANSVADFLIRHGIDPDRLEVRGFGETRPKVPNTSPENRAMNRRVVISILDRMD